MELCLYIGPVREVVLQVAIALIDEDLTRRRVTRPFMRADSENSQPCLLSATHILLCQSRKQKLNIENNERNLVSMSHGIRIVVAALGRMGMEGSGGLSQYMYTYIG